VSVARFQVVGKLDGTGRMLEGTVAIERDAGLVSVRPLRRRRVYTLTLSDVATMVCQRVIRAEVFSRRLEKARRRGSYGRR